MAKKEVDKKNFRADCAYFIGKTHLVCQDYARVGDTVDTVYAIVSDGCSSSPDTDCGARIMTLEAEKICKCEKEIDGNVLAMNVRDKINSLGLNPMASDATLMVMRANRAQAVFTVYGDGVIVAKNREDRGGSIFVAVITSPCNYPIYLSYRIDSARRDSLLQVSNGISEVNSVIVGKDGTVKADDFVGDLRTCLPFAPIECSLNTANYEWATIMTDGAQSFYDLLITETSKSTEAIPCETIVRDALQFKGYNGQFVHRRIKQYLEECAKKNRFHADDFTAATIYFG